jgi:hypothetical protein
MLLPRPRIGTRVMPRSSWNFLDKELLSWWLTEDNFEEVVSHFSSCAAAWSLRPVFWLPPTAPQSKSAAQYLNGRDGCLKSTFSANAGLKSIWPGMNISMK